MSYTQTQEKTGYPAENSGNDTNRTGRPDGQGQPQSRQGTPNEDQPNDTGTGGAEPKMDVTSYVRPVEGGVEPKRLSDGVGAPFPAA